MAVRERESAVSALESKVLAPSHTRLHCLSLLPRRQDLCVLDINQGFNAITTVLALLALLLRARGQAELYGSVLLRCLDEGQHLLKRGSRPEKRSWVDGQMALCSHRPLVHSDDLII